MRKSDSLKWQAYHGLARAVVMTNSVAALPSHERALLSEIDLDTFVTGLTGEDTADNDIVVQASSPGLGSANLTIPVSIDASMDSVLATAALSVGKPVHL